MQKHQSASLEDYDSNVKNTTNLINESQDGMIEEEDFYNDFGDGSPAHNQLSPKTEGKAGSMIGHATTLNPKK